MAEEKNETAKKEAKKSEEKKTAVAEKKIEKKKVETEKKTEQKQKKDSKEKQTPAEVWNTLQHSLLTEKSIGLVESQNKLVFIVRRAANKDSIKWAVEKAFEVKVDSVKTLIDQKGRKKAFVKLDRNFNAGEIATRLGML